MAGIEGGQKKREEREGKKKRKEEWEEKEEKGEQIKWPDLCCVETVAVARWRERMAGESRRLPAARDNTLALCSLCCVLLLVAVSLSLSAIRDNYG